MCQREWKMIPQTKKEEEEEKKEEDQEEEEKEEDMRKKRSYLRYNNWKNQSNRDISNGGGNGNGGAAAGGLKGNNKNNNEGMAGCYCWVSAYVNYGRTMMLWDRYFGERFLMVAVWTCLMLGSVLSVGTYIYMCKEHFQRHEHTLGSMCDERARMLQDQFVASMNHVKAMTVLVSTFHLEMSPSAINQKVFAAYTARTAFERPLMSGVAYAHRIRDHEREQFERHQGWSIRDMYSKDVQSAQEEYAPTIFSQETVSYLISLDMMSGQHDRDNIIRARESGKGALTSPFKLLDANHHLGVVFTFAVYNRNLAEDATAEQRIAATVGYLGGAFDVESLVENLLNQLSVSMAIEVNVYDTTKRSEPVLMYGSGIQNSSKSYTSALDFGDPYRKHEMRCSYSVEPRSPTSALGSAAGIFIIAALIAHILHAARTRIHKVEQDYREMEELKARAEAADVAKSQFLATVSHEIRTPMNGVLGMLQMLMDTNLDATQKEFAQTAQASGKALITLINEVLDQAKIESGLIELESVAFNVRMILDSVLSLFAGKTQARGIELAVFVSERVPEVLIGDPSRFQQIITNLVSNSVKFTEKGHIFVCVHLAEEATVQTERLSNDNDYYNTLSGCRAVDGRHSWESFKMLLHQCGNPKDTAGVGAGQMMMSKSASNSCSAVDVVELAVSVEDTGIGIPHHAQYRVFTPFMQADSSTSRTYGGTGIGLSISRCLVELMGGEIRFTSQPGTGTTFFLTVCFKKGEVIDKHDNDFLGTAQLQNQFKGMKALVLDGRPVRAAVTKYHLQRFGIDVDCITSSQIALSVLNSMDGSLPAPDSHSSYSVRDGVDMVLIEKDAWGSGTGLLFPSQVRAGLFPRGPFLQSKGLLKIILLATSLTAEETQKAKAAGFADTVVVKPLRASMLSVCLQLALGFGKRRELVKEPSKMSFPQNSVLSGKNILVVDDNAVNRRVAEAALRKYGANVVCADSGKSAIAILGQPHNFDACFMDVQMPEIDGFEATKQIRAAELANVDSVSIGGEMRGSNNNRCHVPIMAMTADVIQATHEECLRSGMDGYVSKPFEEQQLYKALAPFLDRKPVVVGR